VPVPWSQPIVSLDCFVTSPAVLLHYILSWNRPPHLGCDTSYHLHVVHYLPGWPLAIRATQMVGSWFSYLRTPHQEISRWLRRRWHKKDWYMETCGWRLSLCLKCQAFSPLPCSWSSLIAYYSPCVCPHNSVCVTRAEKRDMQHKLKEYIRQRTLQFTTVIRTE
jgi:hypothetical protein